MIKQAIKILFSPVTACVGVETVRHKLQGGAGCWVLSTELPRPCAVLPYTLRL